MTTLIDHLRALLGSQSLATETPLLTAADARAARLPREHGVLHSKAVQDAIDELSASSTSPSEATRAAYYLGLQIGWRGAAVTPVTTRSGGREKRDSLSLPDSPSWLELAARTCRRALLLFSAPGQTQG
jgi:hypothetical protein